MIVSKLNYHYVGWLTWQMFSCWLNDVNRSLKGTYNTSFWVCDEMNAQKPKLNNAKGKSKNEKVSLYSFIEAFV